MKSEKLKMLVVIPTAFCFGLQYTTLDLLTASRNSIDAYFLLTRWNDGVFERLLKARGFRYSFSWLGMFSRKLDRRNLQMSLESIVKLPRLYYDFVKLNRTIRPDVLFFANHHELILLMPLLLFTRKKVVCHMHDPSPPIAFQKLNFLLYGLRVDHFIAISNSVKQRLTQLGCAEKKISVIHNGIPLAHDSNASLPTNFKTRFNWPDNSFVIGITGQMAATKGHEDLLKAFSIAYASNSLLRLVIGGREQEPLFSILSSEIAKGGLADHVRFSGWLKEAGEFYQSIDLLVLASRHEEGYGLVVAEMMSYGKPVVITNSGGAAEIVINNVNGFIVPKRGIDELVEKIVLLSTNRVLYQELGSNAKKRVEAEFDISVAASRFITKIQNILYGIR